MSPDAPPEHLVESALPRVTLRNSFSHSYDSAIAAARTCYSPRLIGPEEITDKQRLNIGAATFYGGHHTVFQHAHFEFGLENVSRQFVWSFLHAHPFYNSEQQSQRYVRLDQARAYVPPPSPRFGPEERAIYERAVARAWEHYRELTALLKPDTRKILGDIWHVSSMSHPKRVKKVDAQAEKRAIEVARYVLPVAAFTTMVHTLSGIVLHRLWRMQAASDTPSEAKLVIGEMVSRIREIDPQFFDRFDNAPLEELPEWNQPRVDGDAFAREFDARLAGKTSVLVDYSANAIPVTADAYRAVVGLTRDACSDAEALDRLLNPAKNPYRLQTLNIGVHAPMMRALQHANFTFAKKLSHTADSQDQRHRMVPGSRPLLTLADTRVPDAVLPMLIAQNPRAREVYERALAEAWAAKNELLDRGVPPEFALYLLPNAKSIRLVESGSLLHLMHKWTMRTCFNAQEEIYQASMEEIAQVRAVHPQLARFLGPPCHLRAGIATPICTEGSHFCGVKVWLDFPNIQRRI
ncbi:MAG: FAD-dependent thymidylate synthase [Acidobacteria bacterium]|nr:FAD-dependent thymidylate synthase [Acidobacteriota bacterium]MCL5289232.1 FAD-dependent thymidylate synthase [Acidobacteriota bacterium]